MNILHNFTKSSLATWLENIYQYLSQTNFRIEKHSFIIYQSCLLAVQPLFEGCLMVLTDYVNALSRHVTNTWADTTKKLSPCYVVDIYVETLSMH